jgi:hypothetical protein
MDALPRKFTPKVEGVQIRTKVKKGPLQIQIDERAKRLTKKVTPYDNSPAYQVLKGTVDSFKAIVDNVMKPDKMVQELIAISQESLPAIIPLMAAAGAKNLLQYEEYRKISNILEFGEVSEMWAEAANFDWAKGKDVALEEYDEHKQLVQTMITRDEIEILMPPPLIKRIEYFIEIAELCETGDTGTVYYPVILKDSKGHLADFSKDSNGKVAHSDIIMGEIKDGELTQLNLIGPWAKFWKKDGPTNYKRRIWKTVTNVSVDPNRLEIEFEGNYKSVPESAARYLYLYASIFDDTYDFSIEDMKENDIGSDSGCI